MALTVFLFKVSHLNLSKTLSQTNVDQDNNSTIDEPTVRLIVDENTTLLSAKTHFRGISLWSNNVPVFKDEASFLARGQQPKKFNFNLAGELTSADKVRMEFYTHTNRKKRKKLIGIFEMMVESLMESHFIHLVDENISDPNNYLMTTTVELKLYYTPPDIEQRNATLGIAAENPLTDWRNVFDEEGRHGGHRYRHVHSKKDTKLRKLRTKFVGRADDADTDSYSDSDFNADGELKSSDPVDEEKKQKIERGNIELLQKSLGRYEGDPYEINEWQIMVHIIQGREFPGAELNPYVCIQIDDQKRYTNIHRSANSPYFGEFFTFDFALPATQMMQKVIFFKVHHSQKIISTFTDTKPVAVFRLDISTIYNEKEHSFERKWAQLINPENIEAYCGHLLLSITVTERGAPSRNLLNELGDDDDEYKPSKALVPAAMPHPLFPVQMKITLYTASELPEMMTEFLSSVSKKLLQPDGWEAVDPYVEITYNTMRAVTSHINGATPVWGEAFYLVGRFPPLIRTIKLSLKDHAAVQRDRIISSTFIDLFSISETSSTAGFLPTFGPTWMFLYGSPREYSMNKDQDGLSEGMGEAVCYKGRLLMEIECHPVSGENTSNMNIQKETGIHLPEAHLFPMKRTFLLFGCLYDVTMIDKAYGNTSICFELSIGSSGYLNPQKFLEATRIPVTSLTRSYPSVPVDNNKQHFRLPIDLQKPILFTKYTFHDYVYRMTLSNRFKNVAEHMQKYIREFESKIDSQASTDVLMDQYKKIHDYVHTLPCGCGDRITNDDSYGIAPLIHPSLSEVLNSTPTSKTNSLDEKRRKKLMFNLESVKAWISKKQDYDESKRYDIVKDLNQIARAFRQMAIDAQPALPDIFLWMISDSKRVAYTRISAEDLLFNLCEGDKGLYNGRVQTFFLKTPRSTDKPLNPSTNAKVQMFLWLGIEEYEPYIYRQLPAGFDMPILPLQASTKSIRYNERHFYEVRCHCLKARALLASDDTGLSDPFLSITVGTVTQTTPILLQSLCPQWNVTLAFSNLMHVGDRESAEQIIGNVVVECYDYDEDNDGPDLIGRFSTTAKLNICKKDDPNREYPFEWFEFKIGDKRAGELLAAFELIEINPETQEVDSVYQLEELPITKENFPPENFVTKTIKKHLLYQIPYALMPPMKSYEIEIMFWGLRECRPIGLQSIQEAEVTIECAGERTTRTIKDVQKYPNFSVSTGQPDMYILHVNLPDDNKFWPHLSILCVQNRLFGMKEVVGNLVVTDLQKFLHRPFQKLSPTEEALANAINEMSKAMPYDFNRVRKSIVDAYEAALASKNKDIGKEKLSKFEKEAGKDKDERDSQRAIINADALSETKEDDDDDDKATDKGDTELKNISTTDELVTTADNTEDRPLKTVEKVKRDEMEKSAGWWNKYYASKAKLRLQQRANANLYEEPANTAIAYADFYDGRKKRSNKRTVDLWNTIKKVFSQAGKAQKTFQRLKNSQHDHSEEDKKKSAFDESLDNIEIDRLKELTLLQTFDIVETDLENVYDYEGFNDCLETFALYKGKGSNRSDETGDDKRIYAKFKGKLRIRELGFNEFDLRSSGSLSTDHNPRLSFHPSAFRPDLNNLLASKEVVFTQTNQQMSQFNLNEHRITLKCRLYVIKATLYRGWDASGKADPFIKIALNDTTIIDDTKGKLHNTLEPVFGKSYEFDVTIPTQNLIRVQIWDWDMTSSNDIIAETKIDIENRFFSCHRATCGLPNRYDSAGYNAWRDTKKPTIILSELCGTTTSFVPKYSENLQSVQIGDNRFQCDPSCVEFILNAKSATTTLHRKVHHESPDEYIQQNTALAALRAWGRKINPKCALVAEHIESRPLFNDEFPDTEQGRLEMWLDFFPMSRPPSSSPIDISPLKPVPYQLRLTIWNTHDVELNDENFVTGEKTSDIYVKAWIIGENVDSQETDIHYRSLTGEGNFNWRFVFDFNYLEIEEKIVYEAKDSVFQVGNTTKKIPPRIVIRVYDADLLSADDFLGECILNLTHFPLGAKSSKKCKANIVLNSKHPSVNLFVNKRLAGHWPMIAPAAEGVIRDKDLLGGKIEAEISLLTFEEAQKNPVGKAREAPQPLDEPNRPKTSFLWFTSPWKTLRFVIWRNFKWPIIIGLIIVIVVIFLLLAIWSLPGEIVKQVATKIFGN